MSAWFPDLGGAVGATNATFRRFYTPSVGVGASGSYFNDHLFTLVGVRQDHFNMRTEWGVVQALPGYTWVNNTIPGQATATPAFYNAKADGSNYGAVLRVLAELGTPSVLVNNAGIDVVRNTFDTTPEQWDRIFAVNMKGMYLGVRALAKDMHEAAVRDGRHASVVNMSSICGLIGVAFQTAYCASKGAVRLYTKALALEMAALGLKKHRRRSPGQIVSAPGGKNL